MRIGPFSTEALLELWRGVVDPLYGRRFIEAGEGNGLEVFTQAIAQLKRVSEAVDTSMQACFILPASQQTAPPASGAAKATVELTFVRQLTDMSVPIIVTTDIYVDEIVEDYGADGPVQVLTGRRYQLTEALCLGPGFPGPVTVSSASVRSGYGANNAAIGAITLIKSEGIGYSNDAASIIPGTTSHQLLAAPTPDVPVPAHTGLYVELYNGSNAGQVRRVVGYVGPSLSDGGSFLLAATAVWSGSSLSGSFQVGEPATGPTGTCIVWFVSSQWVVFDRVFGTFASMDQIVGDFSGAQITLENLTQDPDLVAETGTASWRVVGWDELGIMTMNSLQPTGGKSAMLDLIGWERKVARANGEVDDLYRYRVHQPADTISPNAIRRAANRVLAPYGYSVTLRETGLPTMRGIYADGDPNSTNPDIAFAYDLDFTVRPDDRFKLAMNYEEFRAFMLIEVPNIQLGDFGMFYDDGAFNAYDLPPEFPYSADGYPLQASHIYKQVWQAVDAVRGAGVGFDLVRAP